MAGCQSKLIEYKDTKVFYPSDDSKAFQQLDKLMDSGFIPTAHNLNSIKKTSDCFGMAGVLLTPEKSKPPLYVYSDGFGGLGVKANKDIEEHTKIIEYTGLVIGNNEYLKGDLTYVTLLKEGKADDTNLFVDSRVVGNLARFINHTCNWEKQNVVFKFGTKNGQPMVTVASRMPIRKDDVLLTCYVARNEDGEVTEPKNERYKGIETCKCGAMHHILGYYAKQQSFAPIRAKGRATKKKLNLTSFNANRSQAKADGNYVYQPVAYTTTSGRIIKREHKLMSRQLTENERETLLRPKLRSQKP